MNLSGGAPARLSNVPKLACRALRLNMLALIRGASLARSTTPMLRFLFPGLTAQPQRGATLFAALSAIAREPHWYVEGQVADTIDGRFRMLATLLALAIVRLEAGGEAGEAASVALTERFIEVMGAEHREIGLGDPNLGRKVRSLVGSLARRVELWRSAVADEQLWQAAVADSVYSTAQPAGLEHTAQALARWWAEVRQASVAQLTEGGLR